MGGGGSFTPYWFSLNNSETVKAVTLAFCSIQQHFIRDIRANFGICDNRAISDFRISGQSLIKENCDNSITSGDIDMKLGAVTKLGKRNKTTSKKIDNNVMSENCDVIVIFPIFGHFGAIRKSDSGRIV